MDVNVNRNSPSLSGFQYSDTCILQSMFRKGLEHSQDLFFVDMRGNNISRFRSKAKIERDHSFERNIFKGLKENDGTKYHPLGNFLIRQNRN